MTFQILGITPLPLPLDASTGFLPSIAATTEILNSPQGKRAKAIVLVSPNNPTGTTYPPELIEEFADLARERGVALIVDETYRDFIVPDSESGPGRPHTLFERPDWRSHVISLASFSKSYKIPGHRLGVIVAGKEVLQAVTTVADCIQVCSFHLASEDTANQFSDLRPTSTTTRPGPSPSDPPYRPRGDLCANPRTSRAFHQAHRPDSRVARGLKGRILRLRSTPVRLFDRRAYRLGKGLRNPGNAVRDSYTARGVLHAGARQRWVAVVGGREESVGAGQVDSVSPGSADRELELISCAGLRSPTYLTTSFAVCPTGWRCSMRSCRTSTDAGSRSSCTNRASRCRRGSEKVVRHGRRDMRSKGFRHKERCIAVVTEILYI